MYKDFHVQHLFSTFDMYNIYFPLLICTMFHRKTCTSIQLYIAQIIISDDVDYLECLVLIDLNHFKFHFSVYIAYIAMYIVYIFVICI